MSRTISVRIDRDLERALAAAAKAPGPRRIGATSSEIIRAILRERLGLIEHTIDNGYIEGRIRGEAKIAEEHQRALTSARRRTVPT